MRALVLCGCLILLFLEASCATPPGSVGDPATSAAEERPLMQEVCERVAAWWCTFDCPELGTPTEQCAAVYVNYCCTQAGGCERAFPATRTQFEECMAALELERCDEIDRGVKPAACEFSGEQNGS